MSEEREPVGASTPTAGADGAAELTAEQASEPEVKALTFVTMRSFLPGHFGEGSYQRLRAALSSETIAVLDQADASDWVSERHMHELMRQVYDGLLDADDDGYMEFARALALAGISRFLKIFLSLASERFVLRKIPVVWTRLRRNAGAVTAQVEDDIVRLSYDGFPYLSDRVYRLLSLANCQALVYAATQKLPLGHVKHWAKDSMILEFELRD